MHDDDDLDAEMEESEGVGGDQLCLTISGEDTPRQASCCMLPSLSPIPDEHPSLMLSRLAEREKSLLPRERKLLPILVNELGEKTRSPFCEVRGVCTLLTLLRTVRLRLCRLGVSRLLLGETSPGSLPNAEWRDEALLMLLFWNTVLSVLPNLRPMKAGCGGNKISL